MICARCLTEDGTAELLAVTLVAGWALCRQHARVMAEQVDISEALRAADAEFMYRRLGE